MKWYFASNNLSKEFFPLIKAAVNSALKNTTLKPHFIYDGEPDELTTWLEERGVKIIYHRVSFYDDIVKNFGQNDLRIPAGAYLRCDIPIIEKEDEYVLYTDCDVLFLKDVNMDILPRPKSFSCSSQFNKTDFDDFNTGVMVMNVKNLAQSHGEFVEFIKQNMSKFSVFDQEAYQLFYRKCNEPLDIKFNHKPYWGVDESVYIVHYHGPKPIRFTSHDSLKNLPLGYIPYIGVLLRIMIGTLIYSSLIFRKLNMTTTQLRC